MKKILLKFLPLLFGLMTVFERAETIEQIGPVTTIDTTDAPDLSKPIVVIGAAMRLDTRNPDVEFSLSGNTVQENQPVGSEVGRFRSSDSVTYSLISGTGSSGNGNFTLSPEGVLKTAKSFDFEEVQEYSIRVLATASGKSPTEKVFTVHVLDVDESDPSDFALSNDSVRENLPVRSKVGQFTMQGGGSAEFALLKGEGDSGNRFFTLTEDGELLTATVLDHSQSPVLSIRVQATQDGVSLSKAFEISVIQNELPPPPPSEWKKKWEEEVAKLDALRQRIEDTNQSILEVEETLVRQSNRKEELEEDIAKIDEETKACEAECAKVELEINEKEKRLDEIRAQNQELAERVEALKDQRNDLQEKDSELAEQVTEKENEAKELNDKLRIPHLKGWHYTEEKGWLWTDVGFYPMMYSNQEEAWLEYSQGSSFPWKYFNHYTEEWQEWN